MKPTPQPIAWELTGDLSYYISAMGNAFQGQSQKFQGNICMIMKPEESPDDTWYCVMNFVMSPYNFYEILSGFSLFISNFSNLSVAAAYTFICVLNESLEFNLSGRT